MAKALRKAKMTRSRLFLSKKWKWRKLGKLKKKTEFLDYPFQENKTKISLLSLQQKVLEKTTTLFSDKGLQTNNIVLKDKNRLVADSSIIANIFNNYFIYFTNA